MLVAAMLLLAVAPLQGQTIEPDVQLHVTRLSLEEGQYLKGVDEYLNRLILSYEWTDGAYNYRLPLKIDILFEKFSLSGIYHRYSAGVMAATKSGIQLRDTRWDFRYSSDRQPTFGDPYDPFTGLIEYYTWVCLGFEGDLLSSHGGQAYYERARLVADAARFESKYALGWDYRRDLVRDLCVNEKYLSIRAAAFQARVGIYYAERENTESARPHLRQAVELMLESSPSLIRLQRGDNVLRFIDRDKFIAALDYCEEYKLLDRLARWDREHSDDYK